MNTPTMQSPIAFIRKDGRSYKVVGKESGKEWANFPYVWSAEVWCSENGYRFIHDFHEFGCDCRDCINTLYPGARR